MKWFRKKPANEDADSPASSFRERVDVFWAWWSAESERIFASVDSDGGRAIQPEVSEAVERLCSGLGWVFGPGENDEGHSFTLSPEGSVTKRFMVRHWFSKAPTLPGWTFYPSRQPSEDFGKSKIAIGEIEVGADSLWITPSVDIENEEIDITAWSPAFADIGRDKAMQILFLYLDEALGEEGTERCIGAIDLGDGKLDRSFPLTELPEHVDEVFAKRGWKRGEMAWGTYQLKEALGDFPRGDIFVGSTQDIKVLNAYLKERGPIDNPIAGSGAELLFVQLPRAIFPEGNEVGFRAEISDAFDEAFSASDAGLVTGGAMGTDAGYIDLLLFDGERGREIIARAMGERGLDGQYQLFPFAKSP